MLSICQICLSTDRTLQAVKEPLSNWHDELCDFGIEDYALYCPECAYMLNKFHDFKEKCLQANKILKKWKKQSPKARPQLSQLKKEMPPSSFGLSKTKNHKVYLYEDSLETQSSLTKITIKNTLITHGFFIDTFEPIPSYNQELSTHNVEIPSEIDSLMPNENTSASNVKYLKDISEQDPDNTNIVNKTCDLKTILIEPYNEEFLKESEVKIEDDILNATETIVIDELRVKNDIDSDFNNDSDHNITENGSECSEFDLEKLLSKSIDSDNSSDNEVLLNKRKRSLKDIKRTKRKIKDLKEDISDHKEDMADVPLNKLKKKMKKDVDKSKCVKQIRGPMKKLNLESIKYNLLCKFGNKEVRDDEGNLIDKDCIIESLDKMHKYTLNKVKRHCLGTKPFTPEAIQVLSQIQKRYGNQFSSVFTTVHLTTTEQILEEFNKRREHESYLASEHKCTLCYRGFKHRKLLDYHVNEYHNPERAHVCHICQMRFKSAPGLCKHNAAHRAVYKCKLCPLVTNYRTVMENHYNQHNGVKYSCEICKAVLNSKPCLNAHMNYMHPSRYICSVCARTFVSECGVTQHRIRKHPNEEGTEGPPSAKCESCSITFVSDEVYQTHLSKSHADKSTAANYAYTYKKRKLSGKRQPPNFCNEEGTEGPPSAKCESCSITFVSDEVYQTHLSKSHADKSTAANYAYTYKKRKLSGKRQPPNFVCRVCKKVEHSIGRMTWHFRTEHPTENTDTVSMCSQTYKHLCHVCGKGYTSITDFNEHKHLHTGAKPYACDKCPKAFHRKTNLRSHLERHFPPTRECQHCGKKFLSAANLNNHIKMHIGIRRYTCELCAKSFLHRSALNAHVRGVHLRIRRARKTNKEQCE